MFHERALDVALHKVLLVVVEDLLAIKAVRERGEAAAETPVIGSTSSSSR